MPLAPGARLGPYEVIEPIGKGGMGEVYRARDTKLDRDVAIKVLPDELAADDERVARFEREAKLLASLNHPNIAGIYGFEESDGIKAIVLELVDGPTLADRVDLGPIPVDEAIAIAKQVADALEAGHEAGIVHRDLKPANVKVREDGTVKVLDYGLAKALETEESAPTDSQLSMSPTLTRQGTQLGVILGTAAYMSPEQAKGRRIDKRTDIWAFGAVLYEMLTGTRAFAGGDVSEVLASVLAREPDWGTLPRDLPEGLGTYLRRCLRKDAKERIRDVGDVRLALDGAFEPRARGPEAKESPGFLRALPLPIALGLSALTALAAGLTVWSLARQPESARGVTRSTIELSSPLMRFLSLAISRDGSFVVYQAPTFLDTAGGGRTVLRLHRLDRNESAPVPGTEGGFAPFVSPAGEWIGFFEGTDLKKVPTRGGPPVTLASLPFRSIGAFWTDDDRIVVGSNDGGLYRVPAAGGTPAALTRNESALESHRWPSPGPTPGTILFAISTGGVAGSDKLAVLDLANGEVTRLGVAGTAPRFVPTGHLLYTVGARGDQSSVQAVAFDPGRLEPIGNATPLFEDVAVFQSGATFFDVSDAGRVVYFRAGAQGRARRTLVWVDRDGREQAVDAPEGEYFTPQLSPDGTRLAVDRWDGVSPDIWVLDLQRGTDMKLTADPFVEMSPLWTPDGERVVYGLSRRAESYGLFWRSADGTGEAEELLGFQEESIGAVGPSGWSPDGKTLAYWIVRSTLDIEMLSIGGAPEPVRLLATEFGEQGPAISPDGAWVAYVSNESGRLEVYVQRFPDLGQRVAVSTAGGRQPLWSRDGRELFYRSPDGVMAVPVETGTTFSAGEPEFLFEDSYFSYLARRTYDVAPDGQRFLMLKSEQGDDKAPRQMQLVENWFEELERLVPVDP